MDMDGITSDAIKLEGEAPLVLTYLTYVLNNILET